MAGVIPKIGRHYIQVVALGGFPLESTPGMLTALGELPIEYRWSSRFIFMEPHEALQHLEVFRKKWKQKVRGFFDQVFNTHAGPIDQDALTMVEDAEAAWPKSIAAWLAYSPPPQATRSPTLRPPASSPTAMTTPAELYPAYFGRTDHPYRPYLTRRFGAD